MSPLRDDSFARGRAGRRPARPFSLRLPFLVFLSLALIVLSRFNHSAIRELRAEAEAVVAPALGAALLPLDPVRRLIQHVQSSYEGFADLERLRGENQRLRQWEGRARDLERKLGELATLAKALEQQEIPYRTVRVIATSSGAFVSSALLEAGLDHGIANGQPVMNADGLIGRIVEAGRRTSRVLLLTDINSRVPVLVGAGQVRAILAGDNGPEPGLMLLPHEQTSLATGEEIVTSGLGGIFPRGLRIGVTRPAREGLRASLNANLGQLEYVSVLLYDNPGAALARELRQPAPEAGGKARISADRGGRP